MCVFKIKDIKYIKHNFCSVTWVMPQGADLGMLRVPRGSKIYIFEYGHVAYQIDGDDEKNRMQVKSNL